jgi:hypothetical protein
VPKAMLKIYFKRAVLILGIGWFYPLHCFADLVDPTRPPAFGTGTGLYNLSEIMIGPKRNAAVIGGHLFHEGDKFEGITVLEIAPNKVKIIGIRGEATLELFVSPLKPVKQSVKS